MGEPYELSESTKSDIREWARRLIDAVDGDLYVSWPELLRLSGTRTMVKDNVLLTQLELAQVISASIDRAALVDVLRNEMYNDGEGQDENDRQQRYGWNARARGLIERLESGAL